MVGIDVGICLVRVPAGELRASWSGRLLAKVAQARSAAPKVGDEVTLTLWPDGRATVDQVILTSQPGSNVLPMRRLG